MAISKPKNPAFIVSGQVLSVAPLFKYDEKTRSYTDDLNGHEIVLRQESGATIDVRYRLDRQTGEVGPLPDVLSQIAIVVTSTETREWVGLFYARDVTDDDLDRIHSLSAGRELAAAGK